MNTPQTPSIKELPKHGWKLVRDSCGIHPSSDPFVQLVRSFFVSIVALVVDFCLLIFLKEVLGIHYLVAATLSFIAGVTTNYILSIWWVFADRKLASRRTEFIIFVIICSFGLLFNLLIISGMVEWLHIDYRIAKAFSTLVIFFWNFIMRKKLLY